MHYAGVGPPARRFPEAWSLLYHFPACQRDILCDRANGNRQLLDFVRNLVLCRLRTTCCVVQLSFLRIVRQCLPTLACALFVPRHMCHKQLAPVSSLRGNRFYFIICNLVLVTTHCCQQKNASPT